MTNLSKGIVGMLLIFAFSSGASAENPRIPGSWSQFLTKAEGLGAKQLLLVFTDEAGQSRATLNCLEHSSNSWNFSHPPMSASVGRNGIANPGMKREGDGLTPHGFFPLGLAFGYQTSYETKMPYRQMRKEDVWIDDTSAQDYNRLVHIDSTQAKSFEHMRRDDSLYKLGLIVEYNTDPVIPEMGSAIFVHFWGKSFRSTAGCLGLPEHHLKTVLTFLDPAKRPIIAFIRKDIR